jgi:hypothetical protein
LLSRNSVAVSVLVALAVALAAGNIWFAAARSTIPIALAATVTRKEVRHEKHPPRDDVWLLDLGSGRIIQVDEKVFDRVAVGDHLAKVRWSRTLNCDGQQIGLEWSADARGMFWAMPLSLAVLLAGVFLRPIRNQSPDR